MNGFEPLRRRIIDYTEVGQWSEVYDGPLEDCESEKLKAENDQLVMRLNVEHIVRQNLAAENAKLRELVRDMWGCISHIGECDVFYYDMAKDGCGISCTVNGEHCCADKLHDRMRELGIEVDE